MDDLNPDIDEVVQAEPDPVNESTPVAVAVEGPVRVQNLPCVAGGMKRFTFTDGITAQRVLPNNPRRSRALIKVITDGGIIHLGVIQAQAQSPTAPQWTSGTALERRSRGELWVSAPIATTVAPITLSVIEEDWASDGTSDV